MNQDNLNQDNPYAASRSNYQNQLDMFVPPHVPDYLVWSILMTIFMMLCSCPVFGIVALVFSVLANSAKQQGDFQTALAHAKKAKLFLLIGLGVIVALIVFYAICMICFVVFPGEFQPQ